MTESASSVYAILLAGGTGTRLWPVSRQLYPKQLVKFIGDDSLVQSTIKRLSPVMDSEKVRIVCGEQHYHETARHMQGIGMQADGKIICEPSGRNTAPAILLAVLHILNVEKDAVLCVFPADHVIGNIERFHERLAAAIRLANRGDIVTFGIKPHYAETGYGYVEGDAAVSEGALRVKRFVEKPDRKTAQQYIKAGNFFWNSGMFAFKASVIMDEFRTWQPDLLDTIIAIAVHRREQVQGLRKTKFQNLSVLLNFPISQTFSSILSRPSSIFPLLSSFVLLVLRYARFPPSIPPHTSYLTSPTSPSKISTFPNSAFSIPPPLSNPASNLKPPAAKGIILP